ncbi:hypothetical protein FACS189485_20220 [Spirochaetia bacterium]|nr:hypothetical protein FACS189485_20220 [Spirochaetia bacterium]
MTAYKKKLYLLSGIVGVLAILYALTLIFDPERVGERTAAFTWLDPKFRDQIDALEIYGPSVDIKLLRKNGVWFVAAPAPVGAGTAASMSAASMPAASVPAEYPARQARIDDFLGILTRRGVWPVYASSGANSAHERLGLTEAAASRIRVRGGAGLPLLDLLVGNGDLTGRNIYLRKAGQNEVRSGEDRLSGYIAGSLSSWYNLRLFPDSEDGTLDVDIVQRLTVYPLAEFTAEGTALGSDPLIFTRAGETWSISGAALTALDKNKVDTYIRFILNAEGEDFISADAAAPAGEGRVVLELGNGSIRSIRIGRMEGESDQWYAAVTGSPYVYALASWSAERDIPGSFVL